MSAKREHFRLMREGILAEENGRQDACAPSTNERKARIEF